MKRENPSARQRPETSEAALLAEGFRRGRSADVEAVRVRVERVVAYRGYGIPAADRADLVQEVMAQLWTATRKPGFDGTGGFLGLVEVVSARRCIDWRRSRRQLVALDETMADSGDGPLARALTAEERARTRQALASLGGPCRRLIELHFRRRYTYRQLAERLDKSEGALRMQMFRCIREVRRILARGEAPPSSQLQRSPR